MRATTSSIESPVVSRTTASSAATIGECARAASRSSRSATSATPSPRRRARSGSEAVSQSLSSAPGATTVPMSRPSATQSPSLSSARWRSSIAARTAGSRARIEAAWAISGARIAAVTSSPSEDALAVEADLERRRVAVARERDRAVHRARVEVTEAEGVRYRAGDGRLAGPRGTVDGDQHGGCHDRAVKLLRPLRERDFALLWTGMTVSLLGDGIYLVAVAWQVYDLENDPVALSLVGTAWTLGMVTFLLTGGVVTDRADRRRVLIAADLVRAVTLVAMGVLSLTG